MVTYNSKFKISVGDDPAHEELTAEIYYEEKFLAIVSQEAGIENAIIEIQSCPTSDEWAFLLSEFLEVLALAKKKLWELRRC